MEGDESMHMAMLKRVYVRGHVQPCVSSSMECLSNRRIYLYIEVEKESRPLSLTTPGLHVRISRSRTSDGNESACAVPMCPRGLNALKVHVLPQAATTLYAFHVNGDRGETSASFFLRKRKLELWAYKSLCPPKATHALQAYIH